MGEGSHEVGEGGSHEVGEGGSHEVGEGSHEVGDGSQNTSPKQDTSNVLHVHICIESHMVHTHSVPASWS